MQKNNRPWHLVTTAAGNRACRCIVRALAMAGMAAAFLATGCSTQERICSSGEYPVKAVGNTTGRACQPNGKEPPPGYVRYPEGKVPKYVGDEWDKYWSTVVVDSNGIIVSGPSPSP
jgi:hypothetical protein